MATLNTVSAALNHEQSQSQSQSKTLTPTLNFDTNARTSKDVNFPTNFNDPLSNLNDDSGGVFGKNYVVPGSVMPRFKLSIMCEKMDGLGLRNYVHNHFKDRVRVQAELPGALRCAPNPAEMILESLEGFHGADDGSKDGELRKMRRCCIILLKQFRVAALSVTFKAREKALKLALAWRERLVAGNAKTLGALGFIHLVSAFGLISEFSMDELVDCSVTASINDEFPELCRAVGLTHRVPDIVQKLIDSGKPILAVKYVFEFNLADKIPPAPILKAYVDESEKLAKKLSDEGKSLMETTARETKALKLVIKIIENHKLESEYPRASLEQRIKQLKKKKNTKMKCATPASAAKPAQHQQQQKQVQQQKGNMLKQKLQQTGIKRPRTSTPVGPAAVLKNVNNGNSTIHQYQQPLRHPTGLFPEHPNPYMSWPAMPFGMVAPTPNIHPFTRPSAGPYGLTGVPMGPSGNPNLDGSHLTHQRYRPKQKKKLMRADCAIQLL